MIMLYGRLQIGIFFIVVGLIAGVYGIISVIDLKKTPLNLNTLSEEQIEKGCVVEGDICYNLGKYAHQGNIWDAFIVPLGNNSYYGLHVRTAEIHSELMQQSRDTIEYINDQSKSTQSVHIKGKITSMSSNEYSMMSSYLSEAGFSDDEIQKYVKGLYIKELDPNLANVRVLLGVPMIFIGLGLIIFEIREKNANKNA